MRAGQSVIDSSLFGDASTDPKPCIRNSQSYSGHLNIASPSSQYGGLGDRLLTSSRRAMPRTFCARPTANSDPGDHLINEPFGRRDCLSLTAFVHARVG